MDDKILEIILVRHGQTNSNIDKKFLGWTDIGLNDEGIKQSYEVKRKLQNEIPDAIYSSPLKRCIQTAEIINKAYNMEINYSEDLKERNFGAWEGLTYREIEEKYPKECNMMADNWKGFVPAGGESAIEAHKRVEEFINCITKNYKTGRVIIVTHSGPVKSIITSLLAMNMEEIWRFRIENCGITRIEINYDGYAYLTMMNG